VPEGEGWAYEVKWDGVRAILHVVEGRVSVTSRNLRDVTSQYPELRGLGPALGRREALLDGEIVALDDDGKPDFGRLQHRMHIGSESAALRLASSNPVVYMAFDLLYLDDRLTLALPYRERRERLEALRLEGPHWRVPAYHVGDGAALLAASREQGLEGIVAKRLESLYTPGKRSRDWLKVKNTRRQEFVIGGWLPGKGARGGSVGSLAVGYYDVSPAEAKQRGEPQRLVYAGNVGAGLKQADLRELERLLGPLERPDSPFHGRQPGRGTVFVQPQLVAEVEFRDWTQNGTLRAPAFKGLRDDKDPREVVLERPIVAPASKD
jgi:bifunctional non-homologous end joining protein LigD